MELIDKEALIDKLEHDIAIDEDILNYVGTVGAERTNAQFDKDCRQKAIDLLMTAPTIHTKLTKYYDSSESVWKVGEVIVKEDE